MDIAHTSYGYSSYKTRTKQERDRNEIGTRFLPPAQSPPRISAPTPPKTTPTPPQPPQRRPNYPRNSPPHPRNRHPAYPPPRRPVYGRAPPPPPKARPLKQKICELCEKIKKNLSFFGGIKKKHYLCRRNS